MDRRFLRPGWIAGHVLVFLAFLTCLRLGWWQWGRTHDADGTAQNLGYALLWPAFGAAFIYMWVRFLHLEVLKDDEETEATDRDLRELFDDYGPAPSDPMAGVPTSRQPQARDGAGSDDDLDPDAAKVAGEPETQPAENTSTAGSRRPRQQRPSQAVTISVAMVGEDDDEDPELTAYNQALAALAEEDRRRAR